MSTQADLEVVIDHLRKQQERAVARKDWRRVTYVTRALERRMTQLAAAKGATK